MRVVKPNNSQGVCVSYQRGREEKGQGREDLLVQSPESRGLVEVLEVEALMIPGVTDEVHRSLVAML